MVQPATSERVIILAPLGRDSQIALMMLNEAGYTGVVTRDLVGLCAELEHGAGLLLISSEALLGADMTPLTDLIDQQPAWSDLPIVLMTHRGGPEQGPASRLGVQLGNVTFLERPFHPATLISLVTTALRGRRRQYEARDRLIDLSQSEMRLQNILETLELQVEERTAELRHNEEALRQSQKMEAVGQLTGGIAHDFNNMLTGIIGSLELLRRRLSRGRLDDLDGLIDLGVTSANRAAALTHRLLAFSRRQSLDSQPLQMNTLVTSMGELLQRSIDESIQLEMQLDPALWVAEADRNQLENALLNLVINARDALPQGGNIWISTYAAHTQDDLKLADGAYVAVSVRDDGSGIAPEVIGKVFDPFFTTKPIGQGTGLGLSTIYGFARQSAGDVQIRSTSGSGTEVTLLLPASQSPLLSISEPPPPAAPTAGEHVLVVEDMSVVRSFVCEVLVDAGYRCTPVADVDSALALLRDDPSIALLLTDVGLPHMNGRELANIARGLRDALPVLFMTGYAENAIDRQNFLGVRMDIVTKPFQIHDLLDKVRRSLDAM